MAKNHQSILADKRAEHGDWEKNLYNFKILYRAMQSCFRESCGKTLDLLDREDHAELCEIAKKLSRLLSKQASQSNLDDYRDIAGYAVLAHNQRVHPNGKQLDLIEK